MAKKQNVKSSKGKVSEDKIVREVIKKYGEIINLKETPYVLIEILRAHGGLFDDDGDGGLPPGGTPPTGPDERRIDTVMLMQEILKLSREIKALPGKIAKQQRSQTP
jgi:hypothetical protein